MVERGGFEPPKAVPSDLQSDPFGHSGTPPLQANLLTCNLALIQLRHKNGAGDRNRTYDLLITNQQLYQLSYASSTELLI